MQNYSSQDFTVYEMIQHCMNGCHRMQQVLYNQFAAKMYGVCLRYARNNSEDAKDIMQDGFTKVFKNLHKFRHDGSFEGWIRTIMIRTSLSYIRDNKKTSLQYIDAIHKTADTGVSIESRLAEKDIAALVKKLPPGYRKIFMLYAIEGYNHREIGLLLNCSEGTSKSQLYRSKTRLQAMLKQSA